VWNALRPKNESSDVPVRVALYSTVEGSFHMRALCVVANPDAMGSASTEETKVIGTFKDMKWLSKEAGSPSPTRLART
jgi:hypothetical protein